MLLGHGYDMAIDMWSLGCMAAEMFLGLPLFPGASEHDLLVGIVDMLGMPPDHVLQKALHTNRYKATVYTLITRNSSMFCSFILQRLSLIQALQPTDSCPQLHQSHPYWMTMKVVVPSLIANIIRTTVVQPVRLCYNVHPTPLL